MDRDEKEQGMRQALNQTNKLYSSHWKTTDNIVMLAGKARDFELGLLQDADFAGNLKDSKSASGGVLCMFASQTCVPISWSCKKHTAVLHSSKEADVISLDGGVRMEGLMWWTF